MSDTDIPISSLGRVFYKYFAAARTRPQLLNFSSKTIGVTQCQFLFEGLDKIFVLTGQDK